MVAEKNLHIEAQLDSFTTVAASLMQGIWYC